MNVYLKAKYFSHSRSFLVNCTRAHRGKRLDLESSEPTFRLPRPPLLPPQRIWARHCLHGAPMAPEPVVSDRIVNFCARLTGSNPSDRNDAARAFSKDFALILGITIYTTAQSWSIQMSISCWPCPHPPLFLPLLLLLARSEMVRKGNEHLLSSARACSFRKSCFVFLLNVNSSH